MADDKSPEFTNNLLRFIAAELHFLNSQTLAREMFGRGYSSLGVGERATVDQTALQAVGGNYQVLTAEYLAQTSQESPTPMGFPTRPSSRSTPEKS